MEITIVRDVLEANNYIAQRVRQTLKEEDILMVNIIGAPGAGKTSLILKTVEALDVRCSVIEGDIASDIDAKKMADRGIPVVQINTGGSCHLNAQMVERALESIPLESDIVFVENVGNLVCPAAFDIGEDFKMALSSIPEGDDKPYKYPGVFQRAKATLLNKIDLLAHVDFDRNYFHDGVKTLNPDGTVFEVSSMDGRGIGEWCRWLKRQCVAKGATI